MVESDFYANAIAKVGEWASHKEDHSLYSAVIYDSGTEQEVTEGPDMKDPTYPWDELTYPLGVMHYVTVLLTFYDGHEEYVQLKGKSPNGDDLLFVSGVVYKNG